MKKIDSTSSLRVFLVIISFIVGVEMKAQSVDGATYALPKTGVQVQLLVEKAVYTPGELAKYARKYFRENNVSTENSTTYRLVGGSLAPYAAADTTKIYMAHIDTKHNIQKLQLSAGGSLIAVNTDVDAAADNLKHFKPSKRAKPADYRKYLSQDILSVGSKMKMAELVAKEIYDIRESRSELTRGQADFMPKDGEQLRIMLKNLDEQENALRQMFEGTVVRDTVETVLKYMPENEVKTVLFRFSDRWGLCEPSDLSGAPYYIKIDNLHSIPSAIVELSSKKAPKDETGIWINRPGKIRASVLNGTDVWKKVEFGAGQFGETENLNAPLFSKKVETKLILNPLNGGLDKIESSPLK